MKTVSTIAKSSSSSPLRLETTKRYQFTGDEAAQHFERHGKEVMDALGKKSYNLKNYVDDANYVIKKW